MLRLTREAGLLAPTAKVRKRAARLHDGTITVTVPDTLWATDATEGWTREGRCAVFVMIDHASGEAWCDAGLRIDRFAAADLLREVCSERFGSVERAVASGLALRYDGGPCFRSEHYQVEINHLGIARSPAYHYEPETNGCAEKFIQTLKEQVLWIERLEFPRFGGHLLTEFVSVGKDVCYAEDAVVFTGVPLGGCEAVAEQRSFGPEARS